MHIEWRDPTKYHLKYIAAFADLSETDITEMTRRGLVLSVYSCIVQTYTNAVVLFFF